MTKPESVKGSGYVTPATDVISSFVMILVALLAIFWLVPFHTDASAANYDVSPSFIPKVAAYSVLILAGAQFLLSVRKYRATGATGAAPRWDILGYTLIWGVVGTLIYIGLKTVGFLSVGTVVLVAGLYIAGQRSWFVIAVTSLALPPLLSIAAWQIFTVSLP